MATNQESIRKAQDKIKSCIASINAFDAECQAEEYTDTDAAWELLNNVRDSLEEAEKELS